MLFNVTFFMHPKNIGLIALKKSLKLSIAFINVKVFEALKHMHPNKTRDLMALQLAFIKKFGILLVMLLLLISLTMVLCLKILTIL